MVSATHASRGLPQGATFEKAFLILETNCSSIYIVDKRNLYLDQLYASNMKYIYQLSIVALFVFNI